MNAIEWIVFISPWVLLPAIAIVATFFLVSRIRLTLHRHQSRLNEIDQKLKRIADEIYYHNNNHKQLSEIVGRIIINFNDLKIKESNKIIIEEIDNLKDLIQAIYQSTNVLSQKVSTHVHKIDHDIRGLREILANINSVNSDVNLPFFDQAIKESVGRTSTLTAITPEIPPVEPSFSEEERKFIKEFNSILADIEEEQAFRQRYKWLTPASCNRDGIIEYTMATDNENLWILPRSGNNDAVLLPSRYLLTNPTLLTSNGEIASRLIGSCFKIIMRDDIERAHLMRFADVEILDRNASSGQILKARIKKKGLLELPSGKR